MELNVVSDSCNRLHVVYGWSGWCDGSFNSLGGHMSTCQTNTLIRIYHQSLSCRDVQIHKLCKLELRYRLKIQIGFADHDDDDEPFVTVLEQW